MEKQEKDTLLWLTFVGYGIGVLMPWTSIVSTFDYLSAQVSLTFLIDFLQMGTHQPASVYPFVLQLPVIITYVIVILYYSKPTSFCSRISGTFFVSAVFMIIMPFLASIGSVNANFWACFVAIALMGVSMGLNNVSLFTLAAELRGDYMAAVFLGQGLGAFFLNILRVYTLSQWPASSAQNGLFTSTLVFYMTTATFLATCGIAHLFQNEKIESLRKRNYEQTEQRDSEHQASVNPEDDDAFVA